MEVKELTCIRCPIGCNIKVTMEEGQVVEIKGNNCHRGEQYARKEVAEPMRTVTTTLRVRNGYSTRVSCKTKEDVPKEMVMEILEQLKDIVVDAPVNEGDVLVENVAGTGVDLIATKSIEQVAYKRD